MAQAVHPANTAMSLPQAAASGDLLGLRAQLDQGADIEARDVHGRTALMLAVLNGHARLVEELLTRGADPNAADADGVTPLRAAAAGHQPTIAAALRRAGAR
jgi:ankyrin repeat protein